MSDTIRIRTTPNGGDKYLKIPITQDFKFIEILSLKISQEDAYRKFCSDYGVVCGRVTCNGGFGIPFAKVSIFLPLDDVDKNDPLIKGLYPYEIITDKNSDGLRYNLLPKDPDPSNPCSTPIGSFPSKREVLDNDTMLEIYCKYYKFTTTTNHAGDYMIFGVPLGTYTLHLDCDISNIGIASQRPYDLISQGTPAKLFDSPTKFKSDTNLDKLIQIKTFNAGINVEPFWGDIENCVVGINRVDFDINHSIIPSAIFMGSIFGDQDKHSINKHCRPRNKLGNLCEQVSGPGSVDMIRKTTDGQIEEFSVEGGRVIDDDGTWAYQIPMNLDYMVTDEQGNLIMSQDPNKGIPTRASVRFRIGMDETGGEGRLRTRAKYLIPNNPSNASEVDYEFGSDTKDTSFRDIYWNKIYTVSNYVSRFQKLVSFPPVQTLKPDQARVKTRNFIGIKEVDGCGDKTPFPYNKVKTDINPIFIIICLIIKIVSLIIVVINLVLIPIINFIIKALNTILGAIINVINVIIGIIKGAAKLLGGGDNINKIDFQPLPYAKCISIQCDESNYAPGCNEDSIGFKEAGLGPSDHGGTNSGLDDCIAFEMAKTLDLFQFDFYNDWVNGSLFGFLLKYKKKRSKRGHGGAEKFCEYDCKDFSGGVDSNNNGIPDNNCHSNLLLDSGFNGPPKDDDLQLQYRDTGGIRDGLIKKLGDEFYYAATTHDVTYKLFATDLINLGSVFDCDWQGIPKIQNLLIPTTYKLPPDTEELDENNNIETSGMINTEDGRTADGEFFSINCIGLHVDYKQVLNIRHICEMGVEIDQAQEVGGAIASADSIISFEDIDDDRGKFFRDAFFALNSGPAPIPIPTNGFTTNFNTNVQPTYDFTSKNDNGSDYIDFRGYNSGPDSFGQTKHSYYFYFGLLPGKTALDKMNQKYFTNCSLITRDDVIIQSTTIADTNNNSTGSFTFSFIGGKGPFTYSIDGIPPTSFTLAGTVSESNIDTTITGLVEGLYIITATDSLGTPVSKSISISGPTPLYCGVSVTKNTTTAGVSDGEITISSVGGGTGPYTYIATKSDGTVISGPAPAVANTIILVGVDIIGHIVTITDSVGATCITNKLIIGGPTPVLITPTKTDVTCYGGNDGNINLKITGGQQPYITNTTGPNGYTSPSNLMGGLIAGTYVTNVVDNLGTTTSVTTVLTNINPQMILTSAGQSELMKQCNPVQYEIPFYYTAGGTTLQEAGTTSLDVEYNLGNGWILSPNMFIPTLPSTTPMILNISAGQIGVNVKIRFRNVDNTCYSNELTIDKATITLPTNKLTASITRTGSGPYTYKVTSVGGIGTITGTGIFSNSNPTYTATITDSVGCTSTVTYP